MTRLLRFAAVLAGTLGVLVSLAAVGLGWWAAAHVTDRATALAGRADHALAETDERLARVEERAAAVRARLVDLRDEADRLAAEAPDLPRVRAAGDRLLERLLPVLDQAATLAQSLRVVAAGFRAVEAVAVQLGVAVEPADRAGPAAAAIDRAAGVLDVPKSRIEEVRSATAVRLTNDLIALVREAAAGSEHLAEGLIGSRRAVAVSRARVGEWKSAAVFWTRVAAVTHTLVWVWVGLGQVCMVGWGGRRTRPI